MAPAVTDHSSRPCDDGFTLIELMVTVLVLAILIGAAVPTLAGAKKRAQDGAAKSNLRSALSAASVYASASTGGSYPQSTELAAEDRSITFVAPSVASTDAKTVSVSSSATVFKASAMSKSGTCQSVATISGSTTWGSGASPCDGTVYAATTFAGSGSGTFADGTGTSAAFKYPFGVEVDPSGSGDVYIADTYNHRIRKITAEGVATTIAGSGTLGFVNATGTSARFNYPYGLAVDVNGDIYVADLYNYAIRKITAAGVVTTFAGTGIAGSADGTGTGASFSYPQDLAFDASGNLFVADGNRIRKITPAGVVTTWFSSYLSTVNGIEVDSAGNVYVADGGNCVIKKITPALAATVYAGDGNCGLVDGTGTAASMRAHRLCLDWNGNLWFTDIGYAVRKVSPGGVVTTVAGSGSSGSANGIGQSAQFGIPRGLAVTSAGIVYVADTDNHRIRKLY